MPWKASSVMEERLRFVARLLDGEAGLRRELKPESTASPAVVWRASDREIGDQVFVAPARFGLARYVLVGRSISGKVAQIVAAPPKRTRRTGY